MNKIVLSLTTLAFGVLTLHGQPLFAAEKPSNNRGAENELEINGQPSIKQSVMSSEEIDNASLQRLTNLISQHADTITDEGIKGLPKLTSLDLGANHMITDEGIKSLSNLTSLDLSENRTFTGARIRSLPQ